MVLLFTKRLGLQDENLFNTTTTKSIFIIDRIMNMYPTPHPQLLGVNQNNRIKAKSAEKWTFPKIRHIILYTVKSLFTIYKFHSFLITELNLFIYFHFQTATFPNNKSFFERKHTPTLIRLQPQHLFFHFVECVSCVCM